MEGNFTENKSDNLLHNSGMPTSTGSTKNLTNNNQENSNFNSNFSLNFTQPEVEKSSSKFEKENHLFKIINHNENNNSDFSQDKYNKNYNLDNIQVTNKTDNLVNIDDNLFTSKEEFENKDNLIKNFHLNNDDHKFNEEEGQEKNLIREDFQGPEVKKIYDLKNLQKNFEKKLVQKKLKHLYKRIDSCSSLLWSHDNHITGKRLRSENDQEDNKLNWKNKETTQTGYGEIALGSMTSLLNLFQNISKLIEYNSRKSPEFESLLIYDPEEYNMTHDSAFLDIGSGFGKPVFHSALQVGCYSKGVEVVPARVEFCLDFFYEYLNEKNFFEEIEEKFLAEINNENNLKKNGEFDGNNNADNNEYYCANKDEDGKSNNDLKGRGSDSFLDKEDVEMNLNLDDNDMNIDEVEVENAKMQAEGESLFSEPSESGTKKPSNEEEYEVKLNKGNLKSKDSSESDSNLNKNTENYSNTKEILEKEEANNKTEKDCSSIENNNFIKPNSHSERNIMFHELKKISGDSYLNSIDFNMSFFQRNLRNKKVDLNSTQISTGNINQNSNGRPSKQRQNGYLNCKNKQIQVELKNAIKLNDLNGKYYNEILKDKNPYFIELKFNPEIIYEDSFIESILHKRNSLLYSENKNYFFREKKLSEAGILFPEYLRENIINFGNHFVLNEITIEITAINDLLHENVLKLINNCIFADSLENLIARSIGVFNENLKVDFNEITNKIENFYVLDLIHMTNTYFYVGKKNLDIFKLQEIIKKSIKASAPDILEYCPVYLILNKAKFPNLFNNNNKENFNSLNVNFLKNKFENVDMSKGLIRNARFAGLFSKEAEKKGNSKNSKGKSNNKNANKIKDLYKELEKQLRNKNLESCQDLDKLNFNSQFNKGNIVEIADDSQSKCEKIAGISSINYIEEISEKKSEEDRINELANDTKMLKEILVDFKYNYADDWAKKLVFVSEDATKCKAYMADKKAHFSHIYSYNKLMSKECRSKIAKILNKTKFKVLAWYSNPKQTKKAGLKNFTFISKFPMQSTSTEKFHVYVYIKTK